MFESMDIFDDSEHTEQEVDDVPQGETATHCASWVKVLIRILCQPTQL